VNSTASENWDQLRRRYRRHRGRAFWGYKTFVPNGRGQLSPGLLRAQREQGRRAADRLDEAIRLLRRGRMLPKTPRAFAQRDLGVIVQRRILPLPLLAAFNKATILDRDGYRCSYCHRSADEVWLESRRTRTLYFEVDHRQPRMRRGLQYSLDNCCTACLFCNGAKRAWPIPVFQQELRSIAKAHIGTVASPALRHRAMSSEASLPRTSHRRSRNAVSGTVSPSSAM
jgi:hypothetical protein